MITQPEALRLADAIDPLTRRNLDNLTCAAAAAELREVSDRAHRLEAQRDALLEALRELSADADFLGWDTAKARAAIKLAEEGE